MARIRTIKPSFFRHGELFDAEQQSGLPLRVAYAGLWTIADREGRFKYKPRDIKVEVLPYDDVNMEQVLTALEAGAFIQTYTANGQKYAYIPAFSEHQHINKNEPISTIPAPPQNISGRAKRVRKQQEHPQEGKGKEGKDISSNQDSAFERFWKEYPRREAKADALRVFEKVSEKVSPEILIAAARAYAAKKAKDDPKFTKMAATWLNKECWADEGIDPTSLPTPDEIEAAKDKADKLLKRGAYDPMREMLQ